MKKSGDKLPKQFAGGEEIDFEAITELEPDVILAPWSGITQKQYDVLKDIAPTVAYPDQAWSTDWDQQIDIIGKALGRTEDTDGLKTKIEKQLADAAATGRTTRTSPSPTSTTPAPAPSASSSPRSSASRWSPRSA
ncbi:hypothetical protein SMICM304S_03557 [Streptomyces microflavus]